MNLKELREKENEALNQPEPATNTALESMKRLNREALLMESLAISQENYLKLQKDLAEKLSAMTDNHALIRDEVQSYTAAIKELTVEENRKLERLRERLKYEVEANSERWNNQTSESLKSLRSLSTEVSGSLGNKFEILMREYKNKLDQELQSAVYTMNQAAIQLQNDCEQTIQTSKWIVLALIVLQVLLNAIIIYKL